MKDVMLLRYLGLSIEEASAMVSERLRETKDWDGTGLKLKALSPESIQDIYVKKWGKEEAYNPRGRVNLKIFSKWTEEDWREFLKLFPRVPTELKVKYGLK